MTDQNIFNIKKTAIFSFLVFTLAIAGVGASFAKNPVDTNKGLEKVKQQFQTKLDGWHAKAKFSGATVGIVLADGTSFAIATGYSDRDAKTPMKPGDLMMAGSVGKTYVAAVALQLIDKGKIGLDDKIEKYLGKEKWFPRLPNAKDITVRQLMNHTSGLVRYEFKSTFTKDLMKNPYKVWKPSEQVSYLLDEKAPFEAGKGWEYSDTNYIVLGMIIEKVSGKTYYSLAKKNLLKPLKLKNTKPQTQREIKGLIPGYAGANNPFGGKDKVLENGKYYINPQFEWTGGGMVTNTEDLARWAKYMYEGKAFNKDLLPEMLKGTSAPMLGRNTKYGLGVIIRPTPKGITYGHSGFFPGYVTDMMYFPEKKIALAIQVNSSVFRDIGRNPAMTLIEMVDILSPAAEKN